MKGSRQSFGIALGGNNDRSNTPTIVKKVVFSERSRGVDVDGQASSFSMRSGSLNEDSVTGAVEMQLERELAVDERGDEDHGDEKKEAATTSVEDGGHCLERVLMLMRKCKFTLPTLAEDGGTGSGIRTQSPAPMSKPNRLTTTTTTLPRPRRDQHIHLHRLTQNPSPCGRRPSPQSIPPN